MLSNKAGFSGLELTAIFGENNLLNFQDGFKSSGVVIDTRILEKGNIFVALKGENIDGHKLIANAFEAGAVACIIEEQYKDEILKQFPESQFIVSDDNLTALGKLANYHRRKFDFPVIAVGGSNGKTTTKEMIAKVLSEKYRVLKTYGNFNNKIGVPLMLLQFSDDYNISVLEVGTNTPGEVFDLSRIIEPTHALITNIGKEHLEFLIDLDGVELEETYLFAEIRSKGFAFVNYDDERLRQYGHILTKFTTFGIHEHSQFRCEYTLNGTLNPTIKVFSEGQEYSVKMNTTGYASALNAIAALAVGTHFEVPENDMISALETFESLEGNAGYGRMALSKVNDIIIINDTYNANPDSMNVALKNLEMIKVSGKKYAVLGDMRELGETAHEEHIVIIKRAQEVADFVLLTGEEMLKASETLDNKNIKTYNTKEELSSFLLENSGSGDCILVKGSRGMRMELIVNNLKELLVTK